MPATTTPKLKKKALKDSAQAEKDDAMEIDSEPNAVKVKKEPFVKEEAASEESEDEDGDEEDEDEEEEEAAGSSGSSNVKAEASASGADEDDEDEDEEDEDEDDQEAGDEEDEDEADEEEQEGEQEPSPQESEADLIDEILDSGSADVDSLDLSYQPPSGFERVALKNALSTFDVAELEKEGKELWLFKVPADLDPSSLKSLTLPLTASTKPSTTAPLARITKPAPKKDKKSPAAASESEEFGVYEVTSSSSELGEMAELTCMLPGRRFNGYRIAPKPFTRYFNVAPTDTLPTPEELAEAGRKLLAEPYVPRKHPEGMKLQSLPFGFDTQGKPLQQSLQRYNLDPTSAPSSSTKSPTKPPTSSTPSTKTKAKKPKTPAGGAAMDVDEEKPKKKAKKSLGSGEAAEFGETPNKRKADGAGVEGSEKKKKKKVKVEA
ncbi:hypothetical protein HK097_003568 [Rhizophlyctis rosea]|uniref:Uncharacterized protein n=1 Tax=Rhizophlyctis rosea TaxID=64517 RepID=A0AAD5X2Y4_9FUNG|nr:hypothetical protein HK097_003568 [Rhizophlyctis rosea]